MKLVRIEADGEVSHGILERDRIFQTEGFGSLNRTGKTWLREQCRLLVPSQPTKIIAVGLNYSDHAAELSMALKKEPVIFLKPVSALVAHKEEIRIPPGVDRVDFEAEAAIVMGKRGKNIPPDRVTEYLLGYTCLNDVTARTIQEIDGQWTRAKSFDTFCPAGPWIETEWKPENKRIITRKNGQVEQNGNTKDWIFSIEKMVSFISKVMTLEPGDIISTGTPKGIGPMEKGDHIEIEIEGIGVLENWVEREE